MKPYLLLSSVCAFSFCLSIVANATEVEDYFTSVVLSCNRNLQGGVKVPTGGKAREPFGMIRCNSGADSVSLL